MIFSSDISYNDDHNHNNYDNLKLTLMYSHTHKYTYTYTITGTAVAQWLRCCATNWKVAGSIPDGVIGIFD